MQLNKIIFLIICLNLFSIKILPEEQTAPNTTGFLEIGLFTNYRSSSDLKDFIVEAITPVWDREYMLTNSFQTATLLNVPEHLWLENESLFFYYG